MIKDKTKKILLVEDEMIIATAQKLSLEKYGYNVIITNSGEDSVDFIKKNKDIDLILMDINLGRGIDGTVAAETILKDHDIPIIFLSSHTEPEIVQKTEEISSYGYVTKNSGITVLDASIKMAFKLYNARKEENINKKKYSDLFNSIQDAILVTSIDTTIANCNPAFTRLFGYDLEEIRGKQSKILYKHQDDFDFVDNSLNNNMNKNSDFKFMIQYYKKNNKDFPGETRLFYLHDESENITGFVAFIRDITEHKLAENLIKKTESYPGALAELRDQALQLLNSKNNETPPSSGVILEVIHELEVHQEELILQNKELIRAQEEITHLNNEMTDLFEFTPFGIMTIDSNKVVTGLNLTAANMINMHKNKIIGKNCLNIISKNSHDLFLDILRKSAESRQNISADINIECYEKKPANIHLCVIADCNDRNNVEKWHIGLITKSGYNYEKK